MAKRVNIVLTDRQHAWLTDESERTSVSASELVRRALERAYRLDGGRGAAGLVLHVSLWRRRSFGRRAGVTFDP
jgi:nucleotide-binding universal stress UspA family protein